MGAKPKPFLLRFDHGKRMKNKKHKDGEMWFNPDYANKLKIFKNGKWVETDPFEDLEERKIKK